MLFLRGTMESTDKLIVEFIHYQPLSEINGLSQQELETGYLFDGEIPIPENLQGKEARMYFNPTTKKLWYEYFDRPLTTDELFQQAINENTQLKEQQAQMSADFQGLTDLLAQLGVI